MKRALTNLFRPWFRLLDIPIHPITIMNLISFNMGIVGAAYNIDWMIWVFPVIVGLTLIFWIWVRISPLRYDQMTKKEKEYYDNSRNNSR